jgi:hypothetical protein
VNKIIKPMAHDFWERVAGDRRISEELSLYLGKGNPIASM